MATFITSKAVGQTITISGYQDEFYYQKSTLQTDTGYWKYYHDGVYSSVLGDSSSNTNQTISVANANGEFTLISCDSSGTPSGNIVHLKLPNNQITSFDGSSLTGLVNLSLTNNSISSVNNLILPSSLGVLNLTGNQLTSFSGAGLSNLVQLEIDSNQLTSFNSTGLTNLSMLGLSANQLTSFSGAGLTSLTMLSISNNQLSTFDKTGLTNLSMLRLSDNQLASIDIAGLANLNYLEITNNPFDRSENDSILDILNSNGISNGTVYSSNGRTSAGTADYNSLIGKGWSLTGFDLPTTPPPTTTPPRIGIRGNWGGNNWTESNTPNDYIPNPIPENGNWNGGSNGTSGNPSV